VDDVEDTVDVVVELIAPAGVIVELVEVVLV